MHQREQQGDRPRNPTYEDQEQESQQQGQEQEQEYQGQSEEQESQGQSEEQEEDEIPYVFQDQHFSTPIQTQHGQLRVLKKFHRHSKYLRGLRNFRFAILEANPQTFVQPHHTDAETLVFVARGMSNKIFVILFYLIFSRDRRGLIVCLWLQEGE